MRRLDFLSNLRSNLRMAVRKPDWWKYPHRCDRGHEWGPGRVIVGWMPCDCPGAMTEPGRGDLWVRCRADGCPAIWYRPAHGWPEDT
jgi:hypothetical protein